MVGCLHVFYVIALVLITILTKFKVQIHKIRDNQSQQ